MERISFQGFGNNCATFKTAGVIKTGYPVSIDSSGCCKTGAKGDGFLGICAGVRNGYATVQLQGYTELSYVGDAPAYGVQRLVYDGEGGIKAAQAEDSTPYVKVVSIDKTRKMAGIIF